MTNDSDKIRLYSRRPWYSADVQDIIAADSISPYKNQYLDSLVCNAHNRRKKQYELTGQTGNVLAIVSDQRTGGNLFLLLSGGLTVDSPAYINTYKPIVTSAHDYYPFGQYMPGRTERDTSQCFTGIVESEMPAIVYKQMLLNSLCEPCNIVYDTPWCSLSYSTTGVTVSTYSVDFGVVFPIYPLLPGTPTTVYVHFSSAIDTPNPDLMVVNVISEAGDYLTHVGITYWYWTFFYLSPTGPYAPLYYFAAPGWVAVNFTPTDTIARVYIANTGDVAYASPDMSLTIDSVLVPTRTTIPTYPVTTICDEEKYHYGYNGQMKDNEWAGAE